MVVNIKKWLVISGSGSYIFAGCTDSCKPDEGEKKNNDNNSTQELTEDNLKAALSDIIGDGTVVKSIYDHISKGVLIVDDHTGSFNDKPISADGEKVVMIQGKNFSIVSTMPADSNNIPCTDYYAKITTKQTGDNTKKGNITVQILKGKKEVVFTQENLGVFLGDYLNDDTILEIFTEITGFSCTGNPEAILDTNAFKNFNDSHKSILVKKGDAAFVLSENNGSFFVVDDKGDVKNGSIAITITIGSATSNKAAIKIEATKGAAS